MYVFVIKQLKKSTDSTNQTPCNWQMGKELHFLDRIGKWGSNQKIPVIKSYWWEYFQLTLILPTEFGQM